MDADLISIKGIRDGLKVTLGDGALPDLLEAIQSRLSEQAAFFHGGEVTLVVGERELGAGDLEQIGELFSSRGMALRAVLGEHPGTLDAARVLNLGTRLAGSGAELAGGQPRPEPVAVLPASPVTQGEGQGTLIRGALRSGQVVSSPGHVTVIGDVNPGAEIIAGGEVVVWGKLRGLVHAGAFGDRAAVVCALELAPTQLRIADIITVSPPGPPAKRPLPEMASVKDGQIVAESWDAGYRSRR